MFGHLRPGAMSPSHLEDLRRARERAAEEASRRPPAGYSNDPHEHDAPVVEEIPDRRDYPDDVQGELAYQRALDRRGGAHVIHWRTCTCGQEQIYYGRADQAPNNASCTHEDG